MSLMHEKAFIKVSTLRNVGLFGLWVVELPALVALRVSKEYTLLHVRSEAPKGPLVPLNEHIGSTAPDTKSR